MDSKRSRPEHTEPSIPPALNTLANDVIEAAKRSQRLAEELWRIYTLLDLAGQLPNTTPEAINLYRSLQKKAERVMRYAISEQNAMMEAWQSYQQIHKQMVHTLAKLAEMATFATRAAHNALESLSPTHPDYAKYREAYDTAKKELEQLERAWNRLRELYTSLEKVVFSPPPHATSPKEE